MPKIYLDIYKNLTDYLLIIVEMVLEIQQASYKIAKDFVTDSVYYNLIDAELPDSD